MEKVCSRCNNQLSFPLHPLVGWPHGHTIPPQQATESHTHKLYSITKSQILCNSTLRLSRSPRPKGAASEEARASSETIAVKSNKALVTEDIDWVRVSIKVDYIQSGFSPLLARPKTLQNNTRETSWLVVHAYTRRNLEPVSGRPVRDAALIKAVWKFRANLLITGKLMQFGWRWAQSCYLGADRGCGWYRGGIV